MSGDELRDAPEQHQTMMGIADVMLAQLEILEALEQKENEIAKLRAELAEYREMKPVAWMYVNVDGECEQIEYGIDALEYDEQTPLYAHPQKEKIE